jgi:hypothetical protein
VSTARVASPEGWQVSVSLVGVIGGASWRRLVRCWARLVVGSRVAESALVDGRCGGRAVVGVGRGAGLVVCGFGGGCAGGGVGGSDESGGGDSEVVPERELGTALVEAGLVVRVDGDGVDEVSTGAVLVGGDGGGRC